MTRSRRIDFFHDYLRKAVEDRYLPDDASRRQAHLRVADYFADHQTDARRIDELPWQLSEAAAWQRLYDLLADLEFFEAAWEADEFEVKASWARLEAGSPLRMTDAYRPVIETPAEHRESVWNIATLFRETGHPVEAGSLRSFLVDHFRQTGDRDNLQASLGNQAVIIWTRGELDEAMRLHKEQERICRELGNKHGLSRSLAGQALILWTRGELDEAMRLLKEVERICRELGNKDSLQTSLGNQALILKARGELDEAMRLLKQKERICRELGNVEGLAYSLANQALLLGQDLHRPNEALPLAEEAYRLADGRGLRALARQIKPMLDAFRRSAGPPAGGEPPPRLQAVIQELMRDPSQAQQIAARLQQVDPELFRELVQWIQSQQ